MSFRQFTLTEAARALPDVQAAVDQNGLAILIRRGKVPLAVVNANLTIRLLPVHRLILPPLPPLARCHRADTNR